MNVDIGTLATLHAQDLYRQAVMARLAGEIAPRQKSDYRKVLARVLRAFARWIEPSTRRSEPSVRRSEPAAGLVASTRRMEPSAGLVASTRQGLN